MNKKDVQLSKSLSWLLRHGAINEGLALSSEGYVSVEDILQHKTFKGKYSKADIERVVNNNEKKRFKLRWNTETNILEIKANQGHTISEVNDTDLIPIINPIYKTVVHGTYFNCWPNIKIEGLSPMRRHHIHLSKGVLGSKVISGLRNNVQIYIFIDLEKALAEGIKFYESENGVILTAGNEQGFLTPNYFEKVTDVKTGIKPPWLSHICFLTGRFVKKRFPKKTCKVNGLCEEMAQPEVQADKSPIKSAKKIRVTGFPRYAQPHEIKSIFSEYGKFTLDKVTAKFANLTFSKEEDAEAALRDSKKLVLYGEFLTVSPLQGNQSDQGNQSNQGNRSNQGNQSNQENNTKASKPGRRKRRYGRGPNKKKIATDETPNDIISPYKLDLSGTFDEQLHNIMAAVRLTQEEVSLRSQLYTDLEKALQPQWPGCKAIPFGSIPTGLGIKSSDADCFISIPRDYRHPDAASCYVMRAKRILYLHLNTFADIVAIPRANTPIVKFFHLPTQVNCDVTFKTPLGTQNSKLIAFLLQKDPRFLHMAVVLKYWAKIHGISGTGRLTNYALVMMIIFYLQSDPMRMLPSVSFLQQSRENDIIIDYWNAGFLSDPEQLPPTENEYTVFELIGGFFQFYAEFNFDEYAICPYIGYLIEKESFRDPELLPIDFERYRSNIVNNRAAPLRFSTAICIQDPIEQSHNVASAISGRLASDLQDFFKYAAAAYAEGKVNNGVNFFNTIFLTRPKILRPKSTTDFKIFLNTKELEAINKPDWKTLICEVMRVIFLQMLRTNLFNLEEKITESGKVKIKYDGVLVRALWKRKQFAMLYNHLHLDLVEKQKKITDEIFKADKEELRITFQLLFTFTNQPKKATIMLKMNNGESNNLREYGKFYTGVVLTWVKALLAPHLKPVVKKSVDLTETIKNLDATQESSSDSEDSFPWRPPPPTNNVIFVNRAKTAAQ